MNKKVINFILGFLIMLVLLIGSVEYFALNEDYLYKKINNKVNVEKLGITKTELKYISKNLTEYLNDSNDNLKFEITINDKKTEAFNEREIKHMVDVKNIFLLLNKIKIFSLIAIFLIIILIRKKYLFKSFVNSFIISSILLVALSLSVFIDFQKIFVYFHEISFSNDLWLLNPKTDLLIQLLPLSFFKEITINILTLFIISNFILIFLYFLVKKFYIINNNS